MCGITGFIRFGEPLSAAPLLRATAAIRHRGPEDEGYVLLKENTLVSHSGEDTIGELGDKLTLLTPEVQSQAGMGFRRLSILDVSWCGHQPMLSEDGYIALTFNGEIFNFKELREILQRIGHRFVSTSDTEVILRGYQEWGIAVAEQLSGMFAIAIFDIKKSKAFLVRDRIGIKPLFVHQSAAGIWWASEIKALIAARVFKPSPDWTGINTALQTRAAVLPHTCFTEIGVIEPGMYWEVDLARNGVEKKRYWTLPVPSSKQNISEKDAVAEFEERLRKSVVQHLQADVSVATLMSGGLDSTLMTALALPALPSLEAFSLSINGSGRDLDETPQAQLGAKHIGARQRIMKFDAKAFVRSLLKDVVHYEAPYHLLEPVVQVADNLHSAGYKVVLNGLGADELLGGYGFYTGYAQWQQRKKYAALANLLPRGILTSEKAREVLRLRTPIDFWTYSRVGFKGYDFRRLGRGEAVAAQLLQERAPKNLDGIEETFFWCDMMHNVSTYHTISEDNSYMTHSVESRYPFLDHSLVEWVASLPISIRYNPAERKPLLRRVAERYLPKEILQMPKKGFNLPFGGELWKDADFEAFCHEHIQALQRRGLYRAKTLENWWEHRHQPFYFTRVWAMVTLEAWWQRYLEV